MNGEAIHRDDRRAPMKFMSDAAFIDALAEEFADDPEIEASEVRKETDPSNLALDIGVVVSIVTIVKFALIDGPLVPKIIRALKRARPKEVLIKTPSRTVRIEYTDDLDEKELRDVLRHAVELL